LDWASLGYWTPNDTTKEPAITSGTTGQYWRGDKAWVTLDKAAVGLGNVVNLAPADLPVSTAVSLALAAKESSIAAGTSGQYWRGDKTWAALNKAAVGLDQVSNLAAADLPISTAAAAALAGKVNTSLLGAPNGVATLDASGIILASQLPSYVDDVLEYANFGAFPAVGASGKLYLALNTNGLYRWSGSAYVQVNAGGASLVLGETAETAYRGDHGKAAYDHSLLTAGNPHGVTQADVGLGNVSNLAPADLPLSTAATAALAGKEPVFSTLPVSKGGTGSSTALVGNRLTRSQLLPTPSIVELGALNASVALVTDSQGLPVSSPVTAQELGYSQGLASNIQGQIDAIVFGDNFVTDVMAATFNTTSTSFVTAHTFTTPVLPVGTYRIEWDATVTNNGAHRTVTLGTRVEGDVVAVAASFRESAAGIVGTLHRTHYFAVTAPGTLVIDLRVSGSAGTTTVGHSRITVWRVA
jgi:hypothetical protein